MDHAPGPAQINGNGQPLTYIPSSLTIRHHLSVTAVRGNGSDAHRWVRLGRVYKRRSGSEGGYICNTKPPSPCDPNQSGRSVHIYPGGYPTNLFSLEQENSYVWSGQGSVGLGTASKRRMRPCSKPSGAGYQPAVPAGAKSGVA